MSGCDLVQMGECSEGMWIEWNVLQKVHVTGIYCLGSNIVLCSRREKKCLVARAVCLRIFCLGNGMVRHCIALFLFFCVQ